ncbi:DUF1015 domain-containing protein [Pseudoflavonifractor sp. 524-17]|uniref:DUF1015 domain-containing protein n=1 Tax=Pseudoflavonifractor sp. 524-17 TaxID=2304577 RepID=UPI00137A7B24|nr:DUF1015 domain-containing protein [Pseudoflavonifractor sp. 524-17]NCE65259.1 DUF1015 domain-containing protein [Pseudoflavonifractor sp. 524-17]
MSSYFDGLPFTPADILLPQNCDMRKWSVVACDQYTSQPEYWQRVEEYVGGAPSTLRLILPESCLAGPNVDTDIVDVNNTMTRYLRENRLRILAGAMIYVERRLSNGKTRRGLVGKVDLEEYDYELGEATAVRATEGVVQARVPPRVAVRKNAPLELPHTMLLIDDQEDVLMEYLHARRGEMEPLYEFELMENGGHIAGWKLAEAHLAKAAELLRAVTSQGEVAFAVGDGNHALAIAKECYERQKRFAPKDQWKNLPARYALAELTNLRDESLEIRPVHRVLFGVEPEQVLAAVIAAFPGAHYGEGEGHRLSYIHAGGEGTITVPNPDTGLEVATLQPVLDEFIQRRGGRMDYVYGDSVARGLGKKSGNMAFLLPALEKGDLFPLIQREGVLPRKTFSIGEANDKRFYLEARKIR